MLRELPIQGLVTLKSLIEALNAQNMPVKVVHTQGAEAAVAVEDAESFARAWRFLREQVVLRHLHNGVIVLEPDRTVIEANVQIGAGTVIHGGNTLQSGTVIGAGCTLYPNNRMIASIWPGASMPTAGTHTCASTLPMHTAVPAFRPSLAAMRQTS